MQGTAAALMFCGFATKAGVTAAVLLLLLLLHLVLLLLLYHCYCAISLTSAAPASDTMALLSGTLPQQDAGPGWPMIHAAASQLRLICMCVAERHSVLVTSCWQTGSNT
jgi:glycerol-3-phosphate acyltransferase PlsY